MLHMETFFLTSTGYRGTRRSVRKPPSLTDDDDSTPQTSLNLRVRQSLTDRLDRIAAITRKSRHYAAVRLLKFGVTAWEEENRELIDEHDRAHPGAAGTPKRED